MGGLAACFIDRDGVVNKMVDRGEFRSGDGSRILRFSAPWTVSEFELLPRVREALVLLGRLGLVRILTTNQPDLAYGRLSPHEHAAIMAEVASLSLDDVYVCPHGSADRCGCKKPKPGMLFSASRKWNLDPRKSFIIGDTEADMEAGRAAGCRTILVASAEEQDAAVDFRAKDLWGAALLIQCLCQGGEA